MTRLRADGPISERLAAAWPETAARVRGYLHNRGLASAAAEDISQEVAVRALRTGVPFADADDLAPWACTVAWRIYLGDLRRTGREDALDQREPPSSVNVEEEVIAREQLREVVVAILTLSRRDQCSLLATINDHGPTDVTAKEAGMMAVVRHRARARLGRALEAVGVAAASGG